MNSPHELHEHFSGDSATLKEVSGPQSPGEAGTQRDGISLLAMLNMLLRQRLIIAVATTVVFLIAISFTLSNHNYTAASVFMPQATSQKSASGLAGLAAQFGVMNGGGEDNLAFYAKLPTSRELLKELALTEFNFTTKEHPSDTLRGTLVQLLGASGETPQERVDGTIIILDNRIAASADIKVGLVILEATAPWPELAELMNRRILELVSEFNMQRRQSHASAERKFVEGRLRDTRHKLDSAESEFAGFLEQNRRYQESPRLTFTASRLQRRIDVQQQVYASLAKSYEDASIEEVRNTPVITIVDPPEGASHKAGSGLLLNGILGIVLGGLLGIGLALIRELFAYQRDADPSGYAEFTALRRKIIGGILANRSTPQR